jgi:3-hydroxybutyryl-CoA dehydrogenase
MDQSGLDIHHEVEAQLMEDLDRGTDPNPVIDELLAQGEIGTDTGRDVYDWTGVDLTAVQEKRDEALLRLLEL